MVSMLEKFTQDRMAQITKTFLSINMYFTKFNNNQNGFCTRLFFASSIIQIFGVL